MSRFVVCLLKLHIYVCLYNWQWRGTRARCTWVSCYVPFRCVFVKTPYLRMSVQLAMEGDSSKVHMGFLLCPMSLCVCSISIFTYFCTTGNGGGLEQGAHPFLVMSRFVVCLFKLHIHACLNNGHCRGTGARCLP